MLDRIDQRWFKHIPEYAEKWNIQTNRKVESRHCKSLLLDTQKGTLLLEGGGRNPGVILAHQSDALREGSSQQRGQVGGKREIARGQENVRREGLPLPQERKTSRVISMLHVGFSAKMLWECSHGILPGVPLLCEHQVVCETADVTLKSFYDVLLYDLVDHCRESRYSRMRDNLE
ncbi:hypothetical protein BT63DRAFT_439828 [Microthyrium microscopicum]|uniref:Uncharacterized protein n=1 Tax=Microthyrium microscopicum TaxID=703497 RepID=A0A6A6UDB1_9PEZI|nr:hypothetical protein BT63DRAFT_439828 [Microthyrium microscopicum]